MATKRVKVQITKCTCEVCGHKWDSRDEKPMRCAGCKTPYWDREPVRRKKAEQQVSA